MILLFWHAFVGMYMYLLCMCMYVCGAKFAPDQKVEVVTE